jgi:acetyl esterase/lipase
MAQCTILLRTMSIKPVLRGLRAAVRLRRLVRGPKRPSWDVDYEAWATLLHHYSKRSTRLPLAWQREALSLSFPKRPPIARTMRFEEVSADGVRAEWFRAPGADETRVILYLHGGGYSIGSIDSHRDFVTRLCLATGFTALVVDYRLAPEHKFPAQLEDAHTAYRWLLEQGVDPARILIGGESAGGGLTFSTLLAARDAGDPMPAGALVISPWVDLEMTGESMRTNARFDYVGHKTLAEYATRFVEPHQVRNPLAAPLHADLRGLPPMLIMAGGAETLLDDARRMAERARAVGVDVTLDVGEDMVHAWPLFAGFFAISREAIERIAGFLRSRMQGARVAPRADVATAP